MVMGEEDWNAADPDTIMIPNSQSSPTTGAYCYPMPTQNQSYCHDSSGELNSSLPYFYESQTNQDLGAAFLNPQSQQQQLFDYVIPSDISSLKISDDCPDVDFPTPSNMNMIMNNFSHTLMMPNLPRDHTSIKTDHLMYENEVEHNMVKDDKRAPSPPTGIPKTLEDEYNWRKYGQKQVKGSEYPRSYYKCTHLNCDVKKKVERAHDGRITQIIYRGKHNHPKPLPNRRLSTGLAFAQDETDTSESSSCCARIEGDQSAWKVMSSLSEDDRVGSIDWGIAGHDREPSASIRDKFSIEKSPGHEKYVIPLDSAENPELSSPPHSQDAEDEDNVEYYSKRRRTDDRMTETNMSSRGVREDKIMLQAESEIDIIDDGYRWRKYGQKVVKGNPNPRSYYKCTSVGCLVRKHVERNPQNIKDVITTYEGKHNHDVPPAKNGTSPNKNFGNSPSVPSTGQTSNISLTRSATLPKLEMPDHFSPPHFERTPFPGNAFLSPGLIGNFGTCMNFGGSSVYHSDFPMPYRSLGLNMPNPDVQQAGMTVSQVPNPVIQPPLTLPRSLSSNMAPVDFNNSQGGFDQFVTQSSHDDSGIRPKQERMDNTTDQSSAPQAHLYKSSSLPPNYGQGFPS